MKRIILTLLILANISVLFAQKHNVQTANNMRKDQNWTEAKKYIDLAYENDLTSNEPKMWMYRAMIYKEIAFNHTDLDNMAIFKATEAHIKCMQPHPKKKNKIIIYKKWAEEDVRTGIIQCGYNLFNTGIDKYNAEDYNGAIKHYSAIFDIIPLDINSQLGKIKKEIILYELFRCSKSMNDINKSKEYLEQLISLNFDHSSIYVEMSNISQEEGDTDKALEYLSKGREKFSDDQGIINAEINLYIKLGRTSELIEKITQAISSDPNNDVYYAIRANCYQSMDMIQEAIADYSSALNINPENSDVLNNIASCYLKQTEPIIKKMNALNINQTSKYKAYKKQTNDLYKKALPHLKKYVELNPEDAVNKRVLKEISYKLEN